MKTIRIGSALAMLALMTLSAQAQIQQSTGNVPAAQQPRLEVPEVAFNFGFVPQGASISHTFWLRSVGGDTLRITDVRPG